MILSLYRRGQNNLTNWTGRFQSIRRSRLIHSDCSYGKGRCFSSFRVQWRKNWTVSWSWRVSWLVIIHFLLFLQFSCNQSSFIRLSGWLQGQKKLRCGKWNVYFFKDRIVLSTIKTNHTMLVLSDPYLGLLVGVGDLFWKFIFHWIGPENDSIQHSIQNKIQNIHSKKYSLNWVRKFNRIQ